NLKEATAIRKAIALLKQAIGSSPEENTGIAKLESIRGGTLHKYYLIFTQLINDMNIYNMRIKQFQVNTKFLNSLPPEWSKFMTDVKLVKDLHTMNFDQLHAYLEQHEVHTNEVRLLVMLLALGNNASGQARDVKCYNYQGVLDGQAVQTVIQNNAAFQTDDLDTYDSDCDDISNAQELLMANISNYGSDVISETSRIYAKGLLLLVEELVLLVHIDAVREK
nr:retrovirus-related Pol polyprotein from transposon TNT 1-94 [Tanacetum cinerariifolium]